MKLFTDIKIGRRLAIGFGITLLFTAIIGVTGIVCVNSINSKVEWIVNVNNVKLKNIYDIRSAFSDVTYLIGEMATTTDESTKQEAKKGIEDARGKYKVAMDSMEKLEINEEGKALIASLKQAILSGKERNNSVMSLAMAGKNSEAAERYGEIVGNARAYMQEADKIIKYNETRQQLQLQEVRDRIKTTRLVFSFLGLLSVILGTWLSRATTRSITTPILKSSAHIDMMSKGDFSISVSEHAIKRNDEMGIFARSMDTMNVNLRQMLEEVASSAINMASASSQLRSSAEQLSAGASQQVGLAVQVATSSTEMNQASGDVARSSGSIASSANEAVKVAEQGQSVVANAIKEVNVIAEAVDVALALVRELGNQSEKIGSIITAIDDIADQTNLLALNAAIEAARAGEQGRGFAVVADEVRKLAEKTAASTAQIDKMIVGITEGVNKSVAAMDKAKAKVTTGVEFSSQASGALKEIIASIETLHTGIHQIASATSEMSATTDEITRDINEISIVSKNTCGSAEEISKASGDLSLLASDLERLVQGFRV